MLDSESFVSLFRREWIKKKKIKELEIGIMKQLYLESKKKPFPLSDNELIDFYSCASELKI